MPIDPVAPNIEIFFFIYPKKTIKNIKPDGKPKIIPSILSNIPPWPGKRFPVSFFRFPFKKRKKQITSLASKRGNNTCEYN